MVRTRFRYSAAGFRANVVSAAGLTAIVTFLAWLFLRLFGTADTLLWTAATALIFFGFCSAAMIWRFLRRQEVVAVRPDGLLDLRVAPTACAWGDIRDIVLLWREDEFRLAVRVWPTSRRMDFEVDLAPLDATVGEIVDAISLHHTVRTPGA